MSIQDQVSCANCGEWFFKNGFHLCLKSKAETPKSNLASEERRARVILTPAINGWIMRQGGSLYVARTWDELDTFISAYAHPKFAGETWKP